MAGTSTKPQHNSYDVVIIGGAIMGSSAAWFLSENKGFDGRILVVERDMSYEFCSTAHTNSCIRQQFSDPLNIEISQFTARFIKTLRSNLGGDDRVPDLSIQNFGYMYLADSEAFAEVLRANHAVQRAAGAKTRLMDAEEIATAFPFYTLDDIVLGSHNTVDEGYWDGAALFDAFRLRARANGVEYVEGEVTAMVRDGARVTSVTLASGETISCGHVINAAGPRAAKVAAMAGIALPVEPRKRFTWIFRAEQPLDRDLPLTIDPSGVHVHERGGGTYLCGAAPHEDHAVDPGDFGMDFDIWENHVWPVLATRIPRFERIRVESEWVGHYAMNTFDQNAILGAHPDVDNLLFINGFSGHGLQQAPAMGRGIAELVVHGSYRSMDLSPFQFDRLSGLAPVSEKAII